MPCFCPPFVPQLNITPEMLADEGALVAAFQAAARSARGRLKLAVLDHVASFPPVLLPVARLCAVLRQVESCFASLGAD